MLNGHGFARPVLPAELTSCRNWLVWRLVHKDGQPKPSKIPYYTNGAPRPGTQGTPEDRAALVTFDEAMACIQRTGDRYTGVGFALLPDSGVVALDFDDCVAPGGVIAAHVESLCAGTYTEISPSGNGVRAFFRGSLLSRKDVDAKRGPFAIEVFGHNGFVTVTGNVTETCGLFGWDEHVSPLTPAVLAMYRARGWDDSAPSNDDADLSGLMALEPTLGMDRAKVASLLTDLPHDLEYDEWVKVGMAVHHETNGEGFDLWHAWSMASPKYTTEKYCRDRWESFGRYSTGAHITMAWVVKQANEAQVHRKYDAVKELKQRIAECCEEFSLREKIAPLIAKDDRLGDMEREQLAQVLFDRLKGVGAKYPIAQVRKLVAERRSLQTEGDAPQWLEDWVYVTDEDKFFRVDSDERLSKQGFNAKFNRWQPKNELGFVVKNASDLALDEHPIEVVTRRMYLPWAGETFEHDGVKCANSYRLSSVPGAAESIGAQGQRAIDLVLRHVGLICGDRPPVVASLLGWIAHNVQHPGVKIRWAPLIKGIEGDGKSLLGSLLAAVMGEANVKQIGPKVIGTDFSDWAHGACVGVLEEIKLTGHNRHDVLNALKPFITNDSVAIHPKGLAEYNIINTMNYLAFTNHADALPLSDTDRRWFIVFTPFQTRAALVRAIGMETAAYFTPLFQAIAKHRAELRRWLLDYQLPVGFDANGCAPHTDEKTLMVGMSMSPEEEAVREVIDEGAEGVTSTVLSSSCLVDAVRLMDPNLALATNALNRTLVRLGWNKVCRLKWDGRPHRIWVKGQVPNDNDALRTALDATLPGGASSTLSTESALQLFDSVPDSVPQHFPL